MAFLGEIKRRKVFQVAAVYVVVAWLIIQVIDVVSEPLSLPDWLDTVVIVLLAVGFPIAMILAWAFDLTSRGIEFDSTRESTEGPIHFPGQVLSFAIQALVLLAVGFLVLDQYLLETPRVSTTESVASGTIEVNRFDYDLPEGQLLRNSGRRVIDLSPDGRRFVYNTLDGLYLRPMGELAARLISGTEPFLSSPTFSPDGASVAYWETVSQQLVRIGIEGGVPFPIADVTNNLDGLSWPTDETILFANDNGIYRVAATGGTPELLIETPGGEQINDPQLLSGDWVLYGIGPFADWDGAQIVMESLATHERITLVDRGNAPHYVRTGHLIYAVEDGLYGVAFDPDSRTTSGAAVPLVQGVMRPQFTGSANYSVSDDGTLVYVSGSAGASEVVLVWVTRQREEQPIDVEPRDYSQLRLSPDGERLAASIVENGGSDVWIIDFESETERRLTFDAANYERPVWTTDGETIVYGSDRGGEYGIYRKAANGTGREARLTSGTSAQRPESFSPDGAWLVYREERGFDLDSDLHLQSMDSGSSSTPLLVTEFDEDQSAISPDGRWIAYVSNQNGRRDTYVAPFPNFGDGRWQISNGGGVEPVWAPDGSELFYLVEDGPVIRLMVVDVETEPVFSYGDPTILFEGPYHYYGPGFPNYAVSLDGERFLMKKEVDLASESETQPRIIVVKNWLEELVRLVPIE